MGRFGQRSARTVTLATRRSPLARLQTELVADALRAADPDLEVVTVTAEALGDRVVDIALDEIGGRGVFTSEIDAIVLDGRADVAVHSAKDLPSSEPSTALTIGAVLQRADVRDALVGSTLAELPPGGVIATGSPRRRAQIGAIRPDLGFTSLRGNIATRLDRIPPGGAIVVALAALDRLGLRSHVAQILTIAECLPQVGQGTIALRCASDDDATINLLRAIDERSAHRALDAERAFLRRLGGGCDAAVGAYAVADRDGGSIAIEGMIAAESGHVVLRRRLVGDDPDVLGSALAEEMLVSDGASLYAGGES